MVCVTVFVATVYNCPAVVFSFGDGDRGGRSGWLCGEIGESVFVVTIGFNYQFHQFNQLRNVAFECRSLSIFLWSHDNFILFS